MIKKMKKSITIYVAAAVLFIGFAMLFSYSILKYINDKEQQPVTVKPQQSEQPKHKNDTAKVMVIEPPIFHVKVVNYGEGCYYYAIHFTNDNFIMEEDIMNVIDLSELSGSPDVHFLTKIFHNKSEAISFAKLELKDYNSCLKYNSIMKKRYEKTVAYRAAHPPKKISLFSGNECNEVTNILIR